MLKLNPILLASLAALASFLLSCKDDASDTNCEETILLSERIADTLIPALMFKDTLVFRKIIGLKTDTIKFTNVFSAKTFPEFRSRTIALLHECEDKDVLFVERINFKYISTDGSDSFEVDAMASDIWHMFIVTYHGYPHFYTYKTGNIGPSKDTSIVITNHVYEECYPFYLGIKMSNGPISSFMSVLNQWGEYDNLPLGNNLTITGYFSNKVGLIHLEMVEQDATPAYLERIN
ncbi:MAG: hypothetical protein H6608_06370 [Flavobacteriales bacterium]|nr:hypothetical protein [Bacteroidota bacterium]MCB9240734.1 hypothetical protein [Flavobacteriales bacterium]